MTQMADKGTRKEILDSPTRARGLAYLAWALLFMLDNPASATEISAPIDITHSYETSVLIESSPAKVDLRIRGKDLRSPFTWSVTVTGPRGTLFSVTHDDSWLNGAFGDEGYMEGCTGYEACKKKWYFVDLPESINNLLQELYARPTPPEPTEISALEVVADKFFTAKKLERSRRATAISEMKHLLEKDFISLTLPISPVQDDASFMYVPSLGYFVPYWDD